MDVWKIGCRWSDKGESQTSIIDVFLKSKTVFIGWNHDSEINQMCNFCKQVKKR